MAHRRSEGRGVLGELPDDRARHCRGDGATSTPHRPRSSASAATAMASPGLIERAAMATTTPDFAWPDFDRWQAAFAAAHVFPARWEGLHRIPPAHTPEAEAYRLRKLALLVEWLDMLARRSTAHAHFTRQGIRARVARQDTRLPCPACEPFNTREVGTESDAMPPFHPGCRCVLVAIPVKPAGRRRKS
jgi:hypothetical protein